MRAAVVIPSEAFAESAGARIRYGRLAAAAAPHELVLTPLATLDRGLDAFIFAKTYQAAAPAVAHSLAAQGKPVVLDVFDDYFCAPGDARLARFRLWLGEMARAVHAFTVSTPALAGRLAQAAPSPPVVIPDPAPPLDPPALAATLRRKQANADPRALRFLWYGIASNPYFRAGLEDLAAVVGLLGGGGTRHTLTILTNAGGARDEALAALAGAPLTVRWREWSEAAEADELARADVALLPVNSGPFATAKSPNRAITALAAGVQVLSLGAPIYAGLAPFIYREPGALQADAASGTLRLRPARVPALVATIEAMAGPRAAARALFSLLARIVPDARPPVAAVVGAVEAPHLLCESGAMVVAPADAGVVADIAVGETIAVGARAHRAIAPSAARHLAGDRLDPRALGLPLPPPLSGHGVIDMMRSRARLAACHAAAEALLPDHARITVHEGVLPP